MFNSVPVLCSGLETVLKTGNISNYPLVCASATASFSVLSDTIKIIDSVLIDKHNRPDLSRLLTTLQQHEREKLNVTAALHLEQVRQKDELSATGDDRVANLLREGVASLKQRANICIESINEVLEDLRYAIADEMEK
jgi:DNA repair REX1-B